MYHCVTNTHMYIYNVHIHMNSKLKRDIKSLLCYNCCYAVDAMFLLYIELTSNKTVFTISITPQWTSSHHHSILQMLQLYGQLKQIFCLLHFESWETKWQLNTNIENKKLNCFIIFDDSSNVIHLWLYHSCIIKANTHPVLKDILFMGIEIASKKHTILLI